MKAKILLAARRYRLAVALFGRRRRQPQVEHHPVDERGVPDLTTFHRPPSEYLALYLEGIREFDFHKRVEGSWGLTARGAESVPLLVELLKHPDSEVRGDAAAALAWMRDTGPEVEQALVAALDGAATDEERDTALLALGQMRSKAALPLVAQLIRTDGTDGDTRHLAVQVLGDIVRRRFDRQPDPEAAARAYLDVKGL